MRKAIKYILIFFYLPTYNNKIDGRNDESLKATIILIGLFLKVQLVFLSMIIIVSVLKSGSYFSFLISIIFSYYFWEWVFHALLSINKRIMNTLQINDTPTSVNIIMQKNPIVGYLFAMISVLSQVAYIVWFMFYSAMTIFNKSW